MKTPEDFQSKYTDRDIDTANRRNIRSDALFVMMEQDAAIEKGIGRIAELKSEMSKKNARIAELESQGERDVEEIAWLEFEINKRKPQFEVGDVVELKASKCGFKWVVVRNDVLRLRSMADSAACYFNLPEEVKISVPSELTSEQKLFAMANELRMCTFDHIPQLDAIIDKYIPIGYGKVKGAK